jgi:DsbC/DsbD-like thiol-disulfide interchange protein
MKNPSDNATPSGNGLAAQALVRLAKATGNKNYLAHAEKLFEAFHTLMDAMPIQVESILLAYDEYLGLAGEKKPAPAAEKAAPRVQRGPVIVELLAGQSKLRAGAKVPLAVKLRLDEGWHIQAHEPAQPNLLGTKFTLAGAELGKLAEAVYPVAEKLATPLGELHVYSGETLLGARLEVPADAKPGPARLRVVVEFQACDDKRCLTPERVELSLDVELAPAGEKVEALHEAEFRKLKLE